MEQRDARDRIVDGESGGARGIAAPGAATPGVPLRRSEEKPAVPRLDAEGDATSHHGPLFQSLPFVQVGICSRIA